MSFPKLKVAGLLLAVSGGAWAAHGTPEAPAVSINGFGTIGAVHSSESNADFAGDVLKPDGPGYTRAWAMGTDSRLGVQLTVHWSERWSGVLQLASEQRGDGSYRPRVEWANAQFKLSDAASLRAGRIALPIFLAGDYRKVGYAMPWIRPPGEVYGLLPVTSNDGLDARYRIVSGADTHELQLFAGAMTAKGRENSTAEADHVIGLSYRIEAGDWTARALYEQARLSVDSTRPMFDAFRAFGPQGNAIADRYDSLDKRFRIITLGASYDSGSWFVTGELARTQTHSWLGDSTGWYLGAGRAFGRLTPYLLLAGVRNQTAIVTPGLSTDGMPAPQAGAANALNQALNSLLAYTPVQNTISIGARWELAPDIALKVQYDYIDIAAASRGPLINPQPAFRPGGNLKLFSVALDFVF